MRRNILILSLGWIASLFQIILKENCFVQAGYIEVKDYEIDYLNEGYTTQFKFNFQLQNGLGANNYLQLTFPFQLYLSSSSLSVVEVQYSDASTTGCSNPVYLPAKIIADKISSKIYYIKFLDASSNPVDLKAAPEWYSLYIKPERGFLITKGVQLPVQAITVSIDSTNVGKPIQYDVNYQFAVLEFTAAPPTNLKVTPIIPSPRKTQIAWSYEVSFQIEPSVTINDYARIIILFKQKKYFTFTGICVSELQTVATGTIPPLDPSVYKCTVDTVNNRIVVELYNGLKSNQSYRFRTTVLNPSHVVPNAGFEVRTMMGYSNQIVQQADLSQAIYTDYLTWGNSNTNYRVFLANNIDLSDSSFVRKAAVITLQGFYNPYKFQFQPNLDTPDSVKLKVVIKIPIGNFDTILTGSIRYYLPRYDPNVPVKCVLDPSNLPQRIICTEIGKLLQTDVYYVTASINYGQTVPISDTFGTITLYSIHPTFGDLVMISETKANILTHFLTPKTNLDRVDYTTDQYGFQMVHSQKSYDASNTKLPLVALSNTNYGLKQCKDVKQKLVFAFKKGANNEFGVNQSFAMRFVTSVSIKAQAGTDNYVESLNPSCSVATEFNTAATRKIITYSTFTEILLNPQGTSNCIQSESITSVFSIGDVTIQGHSSSYGADESSINFYGALYDSFTDERAPTRYFAVNAFTISQSGACDTSDLNGISVTLSNFYTSSGSQTGKSDGQQFPAFIRVTGYFTDTEKTAAKRIAVFFNNVDFFTEDTDSYGRNIASCSSSINKKQQCWGYNGQNDQSTSIHTMKRVEFDVSSTIASVTNTTPLQLLIPVSAINSSTTVRVFISIMTEFASDKTLSATYINSYTKSQFYIFTGTTVAPETSQSLLSYRLDSTSKVQGDKSISDLYIGHKSSVTKVLRNTDTPSLTGSAFVITGDWKMYSDTLTIKESNNIVNTSKSSESCLGFQYNYLGASYRYGIYCPFTKIGASDPDIADSTKVTFNDFVYPALGPQKLDNTYISWSQNTGNIISSFKDVISTDPSAQLSPNKIQNVQAVQVKRFTKDNRVVWYFTTTNPIPKDGQIQISLVQSNSWLFSVSEKSDANCYLMYETDTFEDSTKKQCVVTSPISNNIVFTLSYDKDFPAGKFKLIQYGLDASVNKIDVSYTITITTQTSTGGNIDQQESLPVVSLTFDNDEKWNTVIDILSYKYSHTQVENSYGTFEMQFKVNSRPILALSSYGYGDLKGQNLELLVASLIGQESNINCYIMKDSNIYFGFKAIDSSDANKIKFYPRDNILDIDNLFTFRCENVANQYKNIQQYQVRLLYRGGQNEIIKGGTSPSGASNPPYKKPTDFPNFILTKYNSLAGAKTQFQFTITLQTQVINQSAAIFVTFPKKYNPKVGTNTLACKVNNQDVYCANIGSDRKIQISAFPTTIPVGQTFNIDIYGIQSPPNSFGDGSIQVMVGSSIDPSSIIEKKEEKDPKTTQDTTNSLQITYAYQANANARESGVYTYSMLSGIAISVNQNIQIEFPSEYGTVISISPPTTCTVISTDSTVTYGTGCTVFGSRIIIKVTQLIPLNTPFLISITPIQNPEQSSCDVSKVMISVLSQDMVQNLMASTVGSSNQPNQRFNYSSTLKYLNWYMKNVQIIYNVNNIEIVAGVYSSSINLVDPTGNFSKTLSYSLKALNSATFSLISDGKIYPGQSQETFKIGCPSTTIPGVFTLSFQKEEQGTQIYGNLGLMNVKVSNTQVEIAPVYTNYKVSVLGQSLPVFFDLSDSIPYTDVSVLFELQIMGLDPKIDLLNDDNQPVTQYTINFSPKSYKGRLQVRSSKIISPVSADHKVKLKMTIFGTDANSYKPSTKDIVFQLYDVAQPTPANLDFKPILQTSDVLQNQITLLVNVNIPSVIYYHVRFQVGPVRTLEEVMLQVNKYTVLNPMDIYQEQFGILNAEENSNSFKIGNLRARQNYIISTWAYDALQRQSSKIDNIFTTKSNGGKLLKINIKFANVISNTQKLNIACYLCQQFAIPCLNIMSYDSIYCESQSKYKLQIADQVNVNSRRLLFNENQARNLDTITSVNTVQFYALSLDELDSDTSSTKIIPIIQNSQFALKLNANDPSLPQILSVESPVEVQPQTTPQLVNEPTASTGITWFYIDKIETQSNSLIWMYLIGTYQFINNFQNQNNTIILIKDSPNGGTPSTQQMKFKLTNRNQTSNNFKIFYFDSSNQVSYNFTDLQPDTSYLLYLIATTENPSLFAPTSFVSQVGKKTLSQQVEVIIHSRILSFTQFLLICLLLLIF